MRGVRPYWRNECGATAAEFALVLTVFLTLIFGIIGLSFALWANETLQYATEQTARCLSVTPTTCSNIQTYAMSQYSGPNISPVFQSGASGGCGHAVTGTATIPLDAVLVNTSINLSASACFP